MNYVLIYLLVGMIYAGLNFKKTAKSVFSNKGYDFIRTKDSDDLTPDESLTLIIGFLLVVVATIIEFLFYPFVIVDKFSKKGFTK